METVWRPKRPRDLTEAQRVAKLQKDSEYEIAVRNLSTSFYHQQRTTGVTAEEEDTYKQAKARLWNDYLEWAKANGLYEEVTPEQQLAEAEAGLSEQLDEVNQLRVELQRNPFELKERT